MEKILYCRECGQEIASEGAPGVFIHIASDGGIDYDADDNHVAIPEEES